MQVCVAKNATQKEDKQERLSSKVFPCEVAFSFIPTKYICITQMAMYMPGKRGVPACKKIRECIYSLSVTCAVFHLNKNGEYNV